jgi:hypothetical protein
MKKLLLLINLLVFFSFAGSCQARPKTSKKTETTPKVSSTATKTDGVKSNGQTTSSGTAGTGSSTIKDTTSKPTTTLAINHSAPNQAQLDSLKKAKTKGKNNK